MEKVDDKALEAGGEVEHSSRSENPSPDRRGLVRPEILEAMTHDERVLAEKKLVRKIDLRLLPMVIIMYILNYIDRYVYPSVAIGWGRGRSLVVVMVVMCWCGVCV